MTVKMPEPMTAPMPSAVRDHGPRVFRSAFSGSSESRISLSIDLREPSCLSRAVLLVPPSVGIGRFRIPFVQGYPPVQDVFGRVRECGGRKLPPANSWSLNPSLFRPSHQAESKEPHMSNVLCRYRGWRAFASSPGALKVDACGRLPLGDAARELLDLLLGRAARLSPLCLGGGLFAGGALQRLAFLLVFNLGGICHLVPLSLESV